MLWDLFSVSSLNVPGDDASLALAAVVVKTGLLGDADAADIGVPALSLGELHGAAAARHLGQGRRDRPAAGEGRRRSSPRASSSSIRLARRPETVAARAQADAAASPASERGDDAPAR